MTDLADLLHWDEVVESALQGDLRPLVELLRSSEPLSKTSREYIAYELEQPPKKKFRRRRRKDLSVRARDKLVLYQVFCAKALLAPNHHPLEAQRVISDRKALDYLSERGELDTDVDENAIKNAIRRKPATLFIPR